MEATENQIKALQIISECPAINGYDFAVRMWSDSKMMEQPKWKIWRNGNSYLFKLFARGFVEKHEYKYPQFYLSKKGAEQINEVPSPSEQEN